MKNCIAKLMIAAIAITTLTFTSCKKEEVVDPAVTNKALLVDVKWKAISLTSKGVEAFGTLAKCSQDDINIFKADGKAIYDQGVTKCDATENQQKDNGTWTLSADGKVINHNDGWGDKLTKTILEISATTLKIEYLDPDFNVVFIETFTKI